MLLIRLAEPADRLAISGLLEAAFADFRPKYTGAAYAATVISPDEVLLRMEEGPVWVAVSEGSMVGTASAMKSREGVYIRGMAVHPASQGKGIGRKLLLAIEAWAMEQGLVHLHLGTTPYLAAAIALYRSMGFQRSKHGKEDFFGTPLFTMEKTLS